MGRLRHRDSAHREPPLSPAVAIAEPVTRIPRIPYGAEFLGRAREFRRRFIDSDLQATTIFDDIAEPLVERGRHPIPRAEMLATAALRYRREMPATGRLALTIEHRRLRLLIHDTRVGVSDFRLAHWKNDEAGLAVMRLEIEAAPRRIHGGLTNFAVVSLHALGRRLQRSFSIFDASVMSDLGALVEAYDAHTHIGREFMVPAGDGAWAGCVIETMSKKGRRQRTLAVRTFLPAENDDAIHSKDA